MSEFERVTKDVVKRLRDQYAPEKIILFGSYAAGTSQVDSDIDLLIIKQTSERFIDRWATVRRLLSDSSRTLALETIVFTPAEVRDKLNRGDQFIKEILEKGRVLYAA